MDIKKQIAEKIYDAVVKSNPNTDLEISTNLIESFIEVPKEKTNGDFSLPCFKLSKWLKKSPIQIADDIKKEIQFEEEIVTDIQNVNGFLNFFISKEAIIKGVIEKFNNQKEDYGKSEMGEGKTVLVEYSSPNIAKPFHIGHLKTTIIGNSLYNIYKFLGFNTIRLNHLGDYGTQFAKLIEGYKRWGNEYDFSENPIDKLAELYVRINKLCEEDEEVLKECRETFKKLEEGDEYSLSLWNKFKELSLNEFNKIYKILGVDFDSWNGESFYSDKMQEVIDLLEKSGKLTDSEGAKIVDLSDRGINTPCIIQKSNGSSIYATRDLAAILYRSRTYDFDKCLYVVGVEQSLHFEQIFEVAKYLGIDSKYTDGLNHVSYGMIRLPEGKMSTRKGNFVKVADLLNESISKVEEIIKEKNIENEEDVAKKIGVGAVIFDDLKESRIKEQVFDLNAALNFHGETGPYVQYTTVRTNSVLEKAGYIPENVNTKKFVDDLSIEILKEVDRFQEVVISAMEKNEPSYITRYILNLSSLYNSFYNQNKVICDDKELQDARLYLTYMTKITLTNGLKLLGIEVPNKM